MQCFIHRAKRHLARLDQPILLECMQRSMDIWNAIAQKILKPNEKCHENSIVIEQFRQITIAVFYLFLFFTKYVKVTNLNEIDVSHKKGIYMSIRPL